MARTRSNEGRGPLYRLYINRLRRRLEPGSVPRHVAMMIDGNRRWAKQLGFDSAAHGHRAGAAKMREFLGWCDDVGVKVGPGETKAEFRVADPDEVAALLGMLAAARARR